MGLDPRHQTNARESNLRTRIYSLDALVDSLEGNEHLCCLVVEAKLKWGRLLEEMDANWKVTKRLVRLLPNLQILQLLPGHIYFTCARSAHIISLHICMPQSETVSIQALEPLLSNLHLRNLSITTTKLWASRREIPETTAKPLDLSRKSPVSHLTLSSTICSATTMGTIVCAPRALKSLHYHYNGETSPGHNAIMPSNFPAPLIQHQSSLVELVIHAQPHQHIPYQYPTGDVMATLRGFVSLKRLGLPTWWMVHPSSGYRESQTSGASYSTKLVEMLPPRLETLQVQLEEVRLNCRNQVSFEHLSRRENVIGNYRALLRWLGEIADWKQSYIQELKEVIVWSSGLKLPHEEKLINESRVEGAFLEQGVRIMFTVCSPDSSQLFGINVDF